MILTVHEDFYEEAPDTNLVKLLPPELRIEKVSAFGVSKPRLAGDIGLRAFFQLYKKAKHLIRAEKIDFLYIPIPSFYCALLGRWLHHSTGIKYGIDYIDPWVHYFPGSERFLSRHWLSTQLAKFLEPIAVKKASLITGVAAGYYKGVIDRNPRLQHQATFEAMPYGGEKADHDKVNELGIEPYLFKKNPGKIQFIYAGAMLPKAYDVLEEVFRALQKETDQFSEVEFHFIGTGSRVDDPLSFNIQPLAEKFSLWNTIVFEYPKRIPYLDVLVHLNSADAVFILGSTEPHYTPSKVYQGILAGKPILAVLHELSTAAKVILEARAGVVLTFAGKEGVASISRDFGASFTSFRSYLTGFKPGDVDLVSFNNYSAAAVTGQLAHALDTIIPIN